MALGAVLALSLEALGPSQAGAAGIPVGISAVDAVRLSEAYRLVEDLGDEIWPGFAAVPMPVVLVAGDWEYLVDWSGPAPEGFKELGVDPRLGRTVRVRPRVYSTGMEASFPAFGLPAVIVFGTAEATGRTSTEWVLTILHEHLHQLQYAAPGYYAETEQLDLAKSDPSGMWMLNYPFPYEDEAVDGAFARLAAALRAAVEGQGEAATAWAMLGELTQGLEPADARYLSFQLWQEGVGRYVELRAAEVAASGFTSSDDFAALADTVAWAEAARAERGRILRGLENVSLAENGRVSFYAVGSALSMLLDRAAPGWKERYLKEKFELQNYWPSE